MSRSMAKDSTDIFRYLVTVSGAYSENHPSPSQRSREYSNVSVKGPYTYKVALSHWRPAGATMKVELQQLLPVALNNFEGELKLEWVTLKTTVRTDNE